MTLQLNRRSLLGAATVGTALMMSDSAAIAKTAEAKKPLFGPAPGIALLSRNENPYGPAPSAIKAIHDTASKGCYYADIGLKTLTEMIAERYGVGTENVVVSSGSTEVLCSVALAWADKGAILCPELFWDTTVKYGEKKGAKIVRVPLADDMGIDLDAMTAALSPEIGLVHICNPNNPTGMVLDGDDLRGFISKTSGNATILIDEAYNELTDKPEYSSVVDLVKEGHDIIVCRTFSKIYGMAGMRVGYAITSPENAEKIRGYLMSFGGNSSGLAAAIASFNDIGFTRYSKDQVVEARSSIIDTLNGLGMEVLPSQTNFLYVKVPDADTVQAQMAQRDIMIRGSYGEQWTNWSRVSTGKIEDVKRYNAALTQLFGT